MPKRLIREFLSALDKCGMKDVELISALYKHCVMLKEPKTLDECITEVKEYFDNKIEQSK
jgi:hypothetical protein